MKQELENRIISKGELEELFKTFQKKCNKEILEIDYIKASKALNEIDKQRGSW
ncbi:27085_t:CDS:1, partial [Dentiscutata erythropus]